MALHTVPEIGNTREMFRRIVQNADQHGVQDVTPWMALACGYRRNIATFDKWDFDWDYHLAYSWMLDALEVLHVLIVPAVLKGRQREGFQGEHGEGREHGVGDSPSRRRASASCLVRGRRTCRSRQSKASRFLTRG